MAGHDDELVKRHEGHFSKLFEGQDKIKENFVRAPTFVITIISVAISVISILALSINLLARDIDKSEQNIMDIAKAQVKTDTNYYAMDKVQQQIFSQLSEIRQMINEMNKNDKLKVN